MLSAIIQARMSSSRLPGKIMKKVKGKPLLHYLIDQLQSIGTIEEIVVATTMNSEDEIVWKFCQKLKIKCYRGDENDVLGRIYQAAIKFNSDPIIRITADCPLIDPEILSNQIHYFSSENIDYCYLGLSFPEGICADLFSFKALEKAYLNTAKNEDREHVTPYFHKNKNQFNIKEIINKTDDSKYRFVVDTPEDFMVVSEIIKHLYTGKNYIFRYQEIKTYLDNNPEISSRNIMIKRNESYDVFNL